MKTKEQHQRSISQTPSRNGRRSTNLHVWLRWLAHPGPRLSQQVIHAGFWVFALRLVERLLLFTRTVVLARMLAPSDFGLLGIALLAFAALEAFSQTGFGNALVQRKGNIRSYLDTAWTIQALRGVLLGGLLLLGAPVIAAFFGTPAAQPIVQVLAFSMLIEGFTNIGVVYFQKDLQFQKLFLLQVVATLADLVVAVTMALLLRSVWALVFGLLAASTVRVLTSYAIHPYRPRPRLDLQKAVELYRFGRWLFGHQLFNFLSVHGDDVIVGRLLGPVALGFYQMAYRISQLPATELTEVVSRVTFPAYARVQDDQATLRKAYLDTVQVTAFVSIPLAVGLVILAPAFVHVVLGQQWMPMVGVLQLLVVWGSLRSLRAIALFQALGKPHLATVLQLARLVLMASLIYPLVVQWGMLGAGMSVVLGSAVVAPIESWMAVKSVRCSVLSYFKLILIPVAGSAVMAGVILLMGSTVWHQPSIGSVAGLVGLGLITYLGTILAFDAFLDYGIRRTVWQRLAAH